MKALALMAKLLRWDVVREIRRRDAVANMSLFAILVLFVGRSGVSPDAGPSSEMGPVFFWITILFAGSIGLSQAFAAEREGDVLAAVVTSPIDLGLVYFSKVAAAWLYAALMEVLLLAAYVVLFGFPRQAQPELVVVAMAVYTLAYVAPGVVLAAMTTTLEGKGEIVLRILLIPLMLPVISLTLRVSEHLFGAVMAGGVHGSPMEWRHYLAFTLALDTIYLSLGYLIFPKVLEE